MRDRVDALDGLVKRAVFRDVLNDNELETFAVLRELFFEKCAPGQRADGAAHRVPGFEVFLHSPNSEIAIRACNEDFSRGRDGDHLKDRMRMGQEIAKMVSFINALARRVHSGLVGHWDSLLISSIAVADEDTAIFSYSCVIVQFDKLKSVLSTLGRRLSMSAVYLGDEVN